MTLLHKSPLFLVNSKIRQHLKTKFNIDNVTQDTLPMCNQTSEELQSIISILKKGADARSASYLMHSDVNPLWNVMKCNLLAF